MDFVLMLTRVRSWNKVNLGENSLHLRNGKGIMLPPLDGDLTTVLWLQMKLMEEVLD